MEHARLSRHVEAEARSCDGAGHMERKIGKMNKVHINIPIRIQIYERGRMHNGWPAVYKRRPVYFTVSSSISSLSYINSVSEARSRVPLCPAPGANCAFVSTVDVCMKNCNESESALRNATPAHSSKVNIELIKPMRNFVTLIATRFYETVNTLLIDPAVKTAFIGRCSLREQQEFTIEIKLLLAK